MLCSYYRIKTIMNEFQIKKWKFTLKWQSFICALPIPCINSIPSFSKPGFTHTSDMLTYLRTAKVEMPAYVSMLLCRAFAVRLWQRPVNCRSYWLKQRPLSNSLYTLAALDHHCSHHPFRISMQLITICTNVGLPYASLFWGNLKSEPINCKKKKKKKKKKTIFMAWTLNMCALFERICVRLDGRRHMGLFIYYSRHFLSSNSMQIVHAQAQACTVRLRQLYFLRVGFVKRTA